MLWCEYRAQCKRREARALGTASVVWTLLRELRGIENGAGHGDRQSPDDRPVEYEVGIGEPAGRTPGICLPGDG